VDARAVLLFILLVGSVPGEAAEATSFRLASHKPFAEVIEDLEFVIGEHNYRITGRNDIGSAIAARLGAARGQATVLHFCNLETAQQVLEIEPGWLLHMPCRIAVWEQEGEVVIEAKLLPEQPLRTRDLAMKINTLLRKMVTFATE
jgi:uncharacterized protein (DUF302 family)